MAEDRQVFTSAFWHSYQYIEPQALKPHFKTDQDVQNWLNDAFTDEVDGLENNFKLPPEQRHEFYVQAKYKGNVIGIIFFESEKDKPNEVYIRQTAVSVDYQRADIGKHLVFSIIQDPDLLPQAKILHLVVRKRNVDGIKFYESVNQKQPISSIGRNRSAKSLEKHL